VIEYTLVTGSLVAVDKPGGAARALDLVARVALVLEALLMAGVATMYGIYAAFDESGERFLWGATVVSAMLAIGVGLVAWGFAKGRRFALGGAFAWQLLQLAIGAWLLGTATGLGVALIVTAVLVMVAVMRRVGALPRPSQD